MSLLFTRRVKSTVIGQVEVGSMLYLLLQWRSQLWQWGYQKLKGFCVGTNTEQAVCLHLLCVGVGALLLPSTMLSWQAGRATKNAQREICITMGKNETLAGMSMSHCGNSTRWYRGGGQEHL